jgi:hypothetical protein
MACNDYEYSCEDEECTNAWDLSRLYGCYESPKPVTNLEREVEVGDCIEVNQGGERFWIQVTDVCVCYVVGFIVSDLVLDHPFNKGDTIRVEIWHIYNVDKGCSKTLT